MSDPANKSINNPIESNPISNPDQHQKYRALQVRAVAVGTLAALCALVGGAVVSVPLVLTGLLVFVAALAMIFIVGVLWLRHS